MAKPLTETKGRKKARVDRAPFGGVEVVLTAGTKRQKVTIDILVFLATELRKW